MANFRMERLFVMLDGPVPGLDPMKAIDAVEFAWHNSNQHAESLAVTPLDAFTYAPFEEPEWSDASEGLKTVRALRSHAIRQTWRLQTCLSPLRLSVAVPSDSCTIP